MGGTNYWGKTDSPCISQHGEYSQYLIITVNGRVTFLNCIKNLKIKKFLIKKMNTLIVPRAIFPLIGFWTQIKS